MCNENESARQFTLTITGTERGEWQGLLQTADGSVQPFETVLQLLKQIQAEIQPSET
jgi:hypothetical protein